MIESYAVNRIGCDYAVGDIHGHFEMLEAELHRVRFDIRVDRVFACGDLVNRGPFSNQVMRYLAEPWFHSVKGNHEEILTLCAQGMVSDAQFASMGGHWFTGLRRTDREHIGQRLQQLPLGIQIETTKGLVGIVHAEVPHDDWSWFVQAAQSIQTDDDYQRVSTSALWIRDRIHSYRQNLVQGVQHVFVGHTPQEEILTLGNVTYLDRGTYKPRGGLVLIPVTQF